MEEEGKIHMIRKKKKKTRRKCTGMFARVVTSGDWGYWGFIARLVLFQVSPNLIHVIISTVRRP